MNRVIDFVKILHKSTRDVQFINQFFDSDLLNETLIQFHF